MVVAGVAGVAVGMGTAAWQAMRLTLRGRLELALALVGSAALLFFALALLLEGPLGLVVPAGATAVGFLLAFVWGGDGGPGAEDDEPPWWPSFEQEIRRWERDGPRTRART